jgi:hypothetical protein
MQVAVEVLLQVALVEELVVMVAVALEKIKQGAIVKTELLTLAEAEAAVGWDPTQEFLVAMVGLA